MGYQLFNGGFFRPQMMCLPLAFKLGLNMKVVRLIYTSPNYASITRDMNRTSIQIEHDSIKLYSIYLIQTGPPRSRSAHGPLVVKPRSTSVKWSLLNHVGNQTFFIVIFW